MKRLVLLPILLLPLAAQEVDVALAFARMEHDLYLAEATAECEHGSVVVGGGFSLNGTSVRVLDSVPIRGAPYQGWKVRIYRDTLPSNQTGWMHVGTAYALCMKTLSSVPSPPAPATEPPAATSVPAPDASVEYQLSAGTSRDLDERMAARSWLLESSGIVGMAIASPCPPRPECSPSNDVLVMWYDDGTLSETPFRNEDGGSLDPIGERQRSPYRLPPGQRPGDIVGIGISGGEKVSAWYRDGTRSTGSIRDLGSGSAGVRYTLPPGKSPTDIVGLAKAPSNGWAYAWYADGTVSAGTDEDLDAHRTPYDFTLPQGQTPSRVMEMAIGHGDWVFAWYGPESTASRPNPAVILPAAAPPDIAALTRQSRPSYCSSAGGSTDIFHAGQCDCSGRSGIVGIAIDTVMVDNPPEPAGPVQRVYTWYDDGTVSMAWLHTGDCDLGTDKGDQYFLPAGKSPPDIVDMAIASDGTVYTWYLDGTVSKGTRTDLGALGSYTYAPAPGKTPGDIIGIGIALSNDWVYAWYRQGTVSTGRSDDLSAYRDLRQYELLSQKAPDEIVGMAIGWLGDPPDDWVYAWYRDFLEISPH